MNFTPLHDQIVVRKIQPDKSPGGIFIPDAAQEKPTEGEVLAAGPGARDADGERIALDVKAGDRILFGKWAGAEVKVDGDTVLIMKESNVLGIVARQQAKLKAV